MDTSVIPVDSIYTEIKERIIGILFQNSATYKSIQDDIENVLIKYDKEFQGLKAGMIDSFPIEDKAKSMLMSLDSIKINDLEIPLDGLSFPKNKEEAKKFGNIFEGIKQGFEKQNIEFKKKFSKLDIKGKSFGNIFKKEIKNYKKGVNKKLLLKEKDLLIEGIKSFLYDFVNTNLEQHGIDKTVDIDITYKPMIETMDHLLTEIIDRICIK